MLKLTVAAACLALSACVAPSTTEYTGASVTVHGGKSPSDPEVSAEANRMCAVTGKRAEYISSKGSDIPMEPDHLFICI